MRRKAVLLFIVTLLEFWLAIGPLQGQLLNPILTESNGNSFDPVFIRNNKIKSVTCAIADKPDNQVIKDQGINHYYEFDADGYLTLSYVTSIKQIIPTEEWIGKGKKRHLVIRKYYIYDTTFTRYYYNKNKLLLLKRVHNGYESFMSYYFEYNDKGEKITQTHIKENNFGTSMQEFVVGNQKILSKETYSYQWSADRLQLKKICLNDEGREYKNVISYFDAFGRKTEEWEEYTVSWMRSGNTYKYNAANQLVERVLHSNTSGEMMESFTYQYDTAGKLSGEKKHKNKVQTHEISYLYNQKLPSSSVDRDILNRSIRIIQYTYQFYP